MRDALTQRQSLATKLLADFDAHADALVRRLSTSNSSIARTAESVAAHTRSIREDLDAASDVDGRVAHSVTAAAERLSQLNRDLDTAVERIGTAHTGLEGVRAALGSAAAEADAAAEATAGALTRQRDDVETAVGAVRTAVQVVGDTLKSQGRAAVLTADTVVVKLKQLKGALSGYVVQLQEAGYETVRRTDAAGKALRDQTESFDGVAGTLEGRADVLRTALETHITEMLAALDESLQQVQPIADSFGRYGEALRAAEDSVRRGTFLRSANVVMDDLASTAVDLDKVLSGGVPRAIWRRFSAGDRAGAVRHLANQIKDTDLVEALRERINDDDSFRPHAIRFITQFERLLRQAAENDPEDLLSISLLTADVGKIYLALSKATNRL